jgi:hypothetical protein
MPIASLAALLLLSHEPPLRRELQPLAFLVGHCWRGQLPDGNEDVHCFESVYGGQHVRDRHEVTGGAEIYRGETLYSWDGAAGAVAYTYWNSLGGVSRGTMRALPRRAARFRRGKLHRFGGPPHLDRHSLAARRRGL